MPDRESNFQVTHSEIVVSKTPKPGAFSSIQQAIDSLPNNGTPCIINIGEGVYYERIWLQRDKVQLIGSGKDKTIITAACYNQKIQADGSIPGTYGSRTVCIDAKQCAISDCTIRNDFDFLANQALPDDQRITHSQSVALLLGRNSDKVLCQDLNLESYHDTLFIESGSSYFTQCQISGAIDFIFGSGNAVFYQCDVIARDRDDPILQPYGYLTAPSTDISQELGFVFWQCRLLKEANVPVNSYALGRPWHPTKEFSDGKYANPDAIGHCALFYCQIDDHIYGWDRMSGKAKNGEVQWFNPQDDARFEEFGNVRFHQQNSLSLKIDPEPLHFELFLSHAEFKQRIQQVSTHLSSWLPHSFSHVSQPRFLSSISEEI
ncbi:MAG: pectinesterase family protein [Vibrio sp.]